MKKLLRKSISVLTTITMLTSVTTIGNITAYSKQPGADLAVDVTRTLDSTILEKSYSWTLNKTVDENTWNLKAAESGTSTYSITATKSAMLYKFVVEGDIIIENRGDMAATNVTVDAALRSANGSTRYETSDSSVTGGPADKTLQISTPGNSITYTYHYVLYYESSVDPATLGVLKVDAIINGTNIARISPDVSSAAIKLVNAAGDPVNNAITVTDDYASITTADDLTHQFTSSGTWTYTRQFTGTMAGTYVNTAYTNIMVKGVSTKISSSATVTVTNINTAPDANDDTATTDEDTAVKITVLANDTDVDADTLTITDVSTPANGTAVLNADKTITYTPNANYNGTDTFTYTISDGNGSTDTATVAVTINATEDVPDAIDDKATTDEDTAVKVNVLANDTDADGDTLTITAVTAPAKGTAVINADKTITYTPNANYNGTDTFTCTISDGKNGTDTETVTVTINAVNDAPKASDSSITTKENTAVNGTVTGTDTEGSKLTFTLGKAPLHGIVILNADGTYTYTPNKDYYGTDTFTFVSNDGLLNSLPATVTITVTEVEDIILPVTGENSDVFYGVAALLILAGALLIAARRYKYNK